MIERNIDCRKHRKSTHLASADLDALTLEKKPLKFTITDVRYETGVDVSGNKTDGYFVKFKEHKKEMVLNSVNRKVLADFALTLGFQNEERYNIGNWVGMEVELYVDRNVKMMGKIVDGIRIKTEPPKPITQEDIDIIKESVNLITTLQDLNKYYSSLTPRFKTNKDVIQILKDKQIKIKETK